MGHGDNLGIGMGGGHCVNNPGDARRGLIPAFAAGRGCISGGFPIGPAQLGMAGGNLAEMQAIPLSEVKFAQIRFMRQPSASGSQPVGVAVTADRGRGKSSALGLAIAEARSRRPGLRVRR